MSSEAKKIMTRRFLNRLLESGLLIIAIALGVGAAASGLSLFFHTNEYGEKLLNSPEYMEVVVTTRGNVEDMMTPLIERTSNQNTVLTAQDLKAGELIDSVTYSYITSPAHIWLMNENVMSEKFGPMPGRGGGPRPGGNPEKSKESEAQKYIDDFQKAKDNPDLIVAEIEEIFGVQVTSQFFDAWELETAEGSLFTTGDYTSSESYIILGSELAETISKNISGSIVGKKLVSWDKLYTVAGVLEPMSSEYDEMFFTPKKQLTGDGGFQRKKAGDDSQLRFYISDVERINYTIEELTNWFNSAYGEDQIAISNPRAAAIRVLNRNRGISILILFLSIAALFIASVNVSNILMSRSLRMKKHVGILKALGASKREILKLFAREALLITAAGSLIGAALALPLSKGMESSLDLGAISWSYLLLGITLSSLLTLIFTIVPARQNSNVNAADAMRSAG